MIDGSNYLLYYLDINIYNSNYKELTKYKLVNRNLNEYIKNIDLDFNKIRNKILKGYKINNLYFYFSYDLKLLLNMLSSRPLFISLILEEIIINSLQNLNFDRNLLIKINHYIYNELYYEIIEIINRLKLNMKVLKDELETLEKKIIFYDNFETLERIKDINNYMKSIEKIIIF